MSVVIRSRGGVVRGTASTVSILDADRALGVVTPAQGAVDDGTLTVSVSHTFTEIGVADAAQDGMEVLVTDTAALRRLTSAASSLV